MTSQRDNTLELRWRHYSLLCTAFLGAAAYANGLERVSTMTFYVGALLSFVFWMMVSPNVRRIRSKFIAKGGDM